MRVIRSVDERYKKEEVSIYDGQGRVYIPNGTIT